MSNFEKKFGKYAIPNLTIIIIGCYVIGYVMQLINERFLEFLTLDPYQILIKGQVWRIFTWIIVPPESLGLFTIIMLIFYYSIGTLMERTLGTYKYNVYIFRGILLTVVAALLCFALTYFFPQAIQSIYDTAKLYYFSITGNMPDHMQTLSLLWNSAAGVFSTYYINISIFLAFAIVYPEMQVLLMFVIPVKVKWMGILDLAVMGYTFFTSNLFVKFAIGAALLNIAIFFFSVRTMNHLRPSQVKRRVEYQHRMQKAQSLTKHKCAICGQTEKDNPELEFRFCSKCNGNYEYCSNHLYTHEHVK